MEPAFGATLRPLEVFPCPHCGKMVPTGKFCGNCGEPIPRREAKTPISWHSEPILGFPNRSLLRFSLRAALFPFFDHRSRRPFALLSFAIFAALFACAVLGVETPVIAISALGAPMLFFLYNGSMSIFEGDGKVAGVAVAIGLSVGFIWAHFVGSYVTSLLGGSLFPSLLSRASVVAAVIAPVIGQIGMLVPLAVVWRFRRQRPDALHGAYLAGVGAIAFQTAATITNLSPRLSDGLLVHHSLGPTVAEAAIRGLASPVVATCVTGLIGAVLWSQLRTRDLFGMLKGRWMVSPITVVTFAFFVRCVLGFADIARLAYWLLALVYLTVMGLALVVLRLGIHHLSFFESEDLLIGEPHVCRTCHHLGPLMRYCFSCGAEETASVATKRRIRWRRGVDDRVEGELEVLGRLARHRQLISFAAGISVAVLIFLGITVVASPTPPSRCLSFRCSVTPKTVPIVRHCVGPRCGVANGKGSAATAGTFYRSKSYGFSVRYSTDPGSSIAWTAASEASLIRLQVTSGAAKSSSLQIGALSARRQSAKQIVASQVAKLYPGATLAYDLPGARVGYIAGYGAAYDYYAISGSGSSAHFRVIFLAAVRKNLAVVVQVIGPYKAFSSSGLNNGSPSIADVQVALVSDPVINSVLWPGTSQP